MTNTGGWRRALLWLAAIAIVAGLIYYLDVNTARFISLLNVSLCGALALLLFSSAFPVLNGLINTYIFRVLGANLTHREGFVVAASASLVNLLPVPGGLLTRAFYLKHRHGLDYAKYASAQLAFFICSLAAYGLMGLIVLLYWALRGVPVPAPLFVVFGLMAATLLTFLLHLDRLANALPRLGWLRRAFEGWLLVSGNPVLLLRLLLIDGLALVFLAVRYWFAFHMLSQNVAPSQVLLFASGSILTQLVTFAPNGLGVREAIVGAMASLLGFDPVVSIAALSLDWLIMLLVVVVTGGFSTVYLGKYLSEQPASAAQRV